MNASSSPRRPDLLASLQGRFWSAITRRAEAEAYARRVGLDPRVHVYAWIYFARLHDTLRDDFPRVAAYVGDEAFACLVADYLDAHPSENPSLRFLGERLPAFLAKHPLSTRAPGAADLAALDWARVEVFDEAHAAVIAFEPGVVATATLGAVPALRLIRTQHRVEEVWRQADRGEAHALCEPGEERLVVWRRGFVVHHRAVDEAEESALRALVEGASFADLCERFAAAEGDVSACAERVIACLRQWAVDEILTTS